MKSLLQRQTKIQKRRKYVTPSIYDTFIAPKFHIVSYLKKEQHNLELREVAAATLAKLTE